MFLNFMQIYWGVESKEGKNFSKIAYHDTGCNFDVHIMHRINDGDENRVEISQLAKSGLLLILKHIGQRVGPQQSKNLLKTESTDT